MISMINNWFDLFNTQHKYDNSVPSYGLDEINQNSLLDRMSEFILNMKVHGKKSLLPFQKGKLIIFQYNYFEKCKNYMM